MNENKKIPCLDSNKMISISDLRMGDSVRIYSNRRNYSEGKVIKDGEKLYIVNEYTLQILDIDQALARTHEFII